jgi:hypothetical protein
MDLTCNPNQHSRWIRKAHKTPTFSNKSTYCENRLSVWEDKVQIHSDSVKRWDGDESGNLILKDNLLVLLKGNKQDEEQDGYYLLCKKEGELRK